MILNNRREQGFLPFFAINATKCAAALRRLDAENSPRRALALAVTTSGRCGAYETRVDTRARKNDTPKVIASKSTPKSMIFSRNSSRNLATKNRHAEGICIKKHAKIDFFFVEIRPEIQTAKTRHGEGNYIKKHEKIVDFSSKFEQKLKREKIDTP